MHRRQLLSLMGLMAAPLRLSAAEREPTPSQTEGPFYPVESIPLRSSLIENEEKVLGTAFDLSGTVVNQKGQALQGATVEIWQCDGNGRYAHPRQSDQHKFDPAFLGSAAQQTDSQGAFRFVALYPVPYTGRPPHIHVKIHHEGEEQLTTQLYLKGSVKRKKRELLQIDPREKSDGTLAAQFEFII